MKIFNKKAFYISILVFLMVFAADISFAQKGKNKIGAYYFDGWSGTTFHITEDLKKNYPEREPKWGWVTSEQKIVDEQVALAAESGLSFFSFCWYHKNGTAKDLPENRALSFYKSSKNVQKLEYCLLVANHGGFDVGPENWDNLINIWLEEFTHPQYLLIDKKPTLIFFESTSLLKNFGSSEAVSKAFEKLRESARQAGLAGVSVGICAYSPETVGVAERCGADIVTGYNYHGLGFETGKQAIPIDTLQNLEPGLWTKLAKSAAKPYIPVSTMGWDPRPWSNNENRYFEQPYYAGFSSKSVESSVKGLLKWMNANITDLTKERIGLLYAWNENGEGAWLTPGKTGLNPLTGLKKSLVNQ